MRDICYFRLSSAFTVEGWVLSPVVVVKPTLSVRTTGTPTLGMAHRSHRLPVWEQRAHKTASAECQFFSFLLTVMFLFIYK